LPLAMRWHVSHKKTPLTGLLIADMVLFKML